MAAWLHRLDVGDLFHDDDLPVHEKAHALAERIAEQSWYRPESPAPLMDNLVQAVEELAEFPKVYNGDAAVYFDSLMAVVYDFGDRYRIWLDAFEPAASL